MITDVMSGRRRLTRVLAVLVGAFAVWLSAAGTANAAPAKGTSAREAPTCRVGAYLSDLYDLAPAKNAFSARLTVWSVCPKRELDPLPDVAFTNSSNAEKSEPSVTEEGGVFRDMVRIQGVFRQDWDLRAFPYDRHRITINITSRKTIDKFRFTPDNGDSGANEGLAPDGWKLTGFRLASVEQHFPTNFGDATLTRGMGSTRSRLVVEMGLARDDPTAFWRLTGPLYLMVLLATAAFLLPTHGKELGMAERLDSMQSRLALLGGGLFVVMLNLQQVSTVVTSTVGLTLIDALHLLTLVYVLLAVVATVLSWRWTVRGGDPVRAERIHHRGALAGLAVYTLVAAALVVYAAGLG